MNLQVLGFTAAVSLLTCVLFSLVPALRASRPDLVAELKGATSRIPGMGRRLNLRHALIVSQVALSLVALDQCRPVREKLADGPADRAWIRRRRARRRFTSSLAHKATARPRAANSSGRPSNVRRRSAESKRRSWAISSRSTVAGRRGRCSSRARISPIAATAGSCRPALSAPGISRRSAFPSFAGANSTTTTGPPPRSSRSSTSGWRACSGRDRTRSRKRVKLFNTDFYEVVGIVARYASWVRSGTIRRPILYRPLTQVYQPTVSLFVRAQRPGAVLGTVRSQVQQLDPRLPISDVWTLSDVVYRSLWTPRMAAWLLTLLGVISLLLAVIGVYGVMAYSVSQRTRELGLRVALGADRGDVIRLVVGEGFRLTLAGIARRARRGARGEPPGRGSAVRQRDRSRHLCRRSRHSRRRGAGGELPARTPRDPDRADRRLAHRRLTRTYRRLLANERPTLVNSGLAEVVTFGTSATCLGFELECPVKGAPYEALSDRRLRHVRVVGGHAALRPDQGEGAERARDPDDLGAQLLQAAARSLFRRRHRHRHQFEGARLRLHAQRRHPPVRVRPERQLRPRDRPGRVRPRVRARGPGRSRRQHLDRRRGDEHGDQVQPRGTGA